MGYHNQTTHVRGNIAAEPDVAEPNGNFKVAEFPIAVNVEEWNGEEEVERTEYYQVSAYNSAATYIEQVAERGDTISIGLRRVTDKWEENGETRSRIVYKYDAPNGDLQILNGGGGGSSPEEKLDSAASGGSSSSGSSGDDDLPF